MAPIMRQEDREQMLAEMIEIMTKYEEVLQELKYYFVQKRIDNINRWADEHLNAEIKIKDIPLRERKMSF